MKFELSLGLGVLFAVGVWLKAIDFWLALELYVGLNIFFGVLFKFILDNISKRIVKDVEENKEFLSEKYKVKKAGCLK